MTAKQGITDVKEQMWLTKINYLRCIYTHVHTVYRLWHKWGKEICLPNKESINGHRCERTNKAAKCEFFMNCSKQLIGIFKKQVWLPENEYFTDHRCERTDMAYKCQIFEAVNLTLPGHYTHVYSVQHYWHKYKKANKICLPNKECIKNKYSCQMHSTCAYYYWVQAYWLTCFCIVLLTFKSL